MARLVGILTIIGIALVFVVASPVQEELYSDKYDDIDVTEIIMNDRMRNQYYNCFMDKAPCMTAAMKFYKDIVGEALITQCQKCTQKQKENFDMLTDYYTQNKPDQWEALVKKFMKDMTKKNDE